MGVRILQLALAQHWRVAIRKTLTVWGLVWAVLEPIAFYFATARTYIETNGHLVFFGTILAGAVVGLSALRIRRSVSFKLPTTNTVVTVCFEDFFAAQGHKGIAVNENFDTEIGKYVSQQSIHGQFISKILRGDSTLLKSDLSRSLAHANKTFVKRGSERISSYPAGTTAVLAYQPSKFILFVLTRTDQNTGKASADVPAMMQSLEGLWAAVRDHVNGEEFSLPLVGGGQSGVGLQPLHLLRLLLLSILVATRRAQVTSQIRLVLDKSLYGQVDLDDFAKDWRS